MFSQLQLSLLFPHDGSNINIEIFNFSLFDMEIFLWFVFWGFLCFLLISQLLTIDTLHACNYLKVITLNENQQFFQLYLFLLTPCVVFHPFFPVFVEIKILLCLTWILRLIRTNRNSISIIPLLTFIGNGCPRIF